MDAMSVHDEARLRRSVYVAAVRAALKETETLQAFAARIGRTREYLQYLLREDGVRIPGPETAVRIAQALPLPAAQRGELLEHMLLAAERRLDAWRDTRQWPAKALPSETMERLRAAHSAATYAQDPGEARIHYQLLRDLAVAFLAQPGLRREPLVYVESCLLLHDAQSVRDRPGDALFHARASRVVMQHLDPADYRRGRERFDHLRVNTAYAESVTLTTLGLTRQAERVLQEAESAALASPSARQFWMPHIYRQQLAVMSQKPRFSLYKCRDLALRAKSACDAHADPLALQASLLVDARSPAPIFVTAARSVFAKPCAVLCPPSHRSKSCPFLGPLHRVIILRTFASASGPRTTWTIGATLCASRIGAGRSAGPRIRPEDSAGVRCGAQRRPARGSRGNRDRAARSDGAAAASRGMFPSWRRRARAGSLLPPCPLQLNFGLLPAQGRHELFAGRRAAGSTGGRDHAGRC